MTVRKKIVCLGGGRGTSSLLQGLKPFNPQLSVITSMADDGGSSGRLRKSYNMMPPGDIVSCIAALMENRELAALVTHRFPGMHKTAKEISGHKLGNLMLLAELQRTGDFYKALEAIKKIFGVKADILPATDERTRLSAFTLDGRRLHSETTMDLALYAEPHGIKSIYITPKNPQVNSLVIKNILEADVIISGPGDLYTNQLPVLIIPKIKDALLASKAKKLFVLNIANKPFETKGYTLQSFIRAFEDHVGTFPFDMVFANNNTVPKIPKKYRYDYIAIDTSSTQNVTLIEEDLVNIDFPLYHDAAKLGKTITKYI
ncbi:MAG: YvcK family protein [Candidatus Levybacteria bacterium]|nr:YvcK family protein [Candidatus Levybacteria bacterium]